VEKIDKVKSAVLAISAQEFHAVEKSLQHQLASKRRFHSPAF
jgi:hypothetical protein